MDIHSDSAGRPDTVQRINYVSICTGGGGLDLGFELAVPDARPVCLVEREAFAIDRLVAAMQAGVMAPAPVWNDAKTFNGRPWRGIVDGVIGGIPCQPHSVAGRKRGSNDKRDLWLAFRRIVVASGAWFCLIENVAGMLSAGSDEIAGAERVVRDLQRLGFVVEGGLFSAEEVGAPHRRERVFILGVHEGLFPDAGCVGRRTQGDAGKPPTRPNRSSGELADAFGCGHRGRAKDPEREAQRGNAVERDCGELVNASRQRRGEGRPEPEIRSGRDATPGASWQLGDASRLLGRAVKRHEPNGDCPSLFPPGPGDEQGWHRIIDASPEFLPGYSRHDRFRLALRNALVAADVDPGEWRDEAWMLEKALRTMGPAGVQEIAEHNIRGMAHGMADRVDRLRMLGNGVVPLAAGYAIRTLATRLATRGSAGAGRLSGNVTGA